MDKLNRKEGRHQVFFGTVGLKQDWQMRCDRRSPRYTTRWGELHVCR
ncbi:DUF4113 domain-containing protein [Tolypothrix sp. VBCCA 56010]